MQTSPMQTPEHASSLLHFKWVFHHLFSVRVSSITRSTLLRLLNINLSRSIYLARSIPFLSSLLKSSVRREHAFFLHWRLEGGLASSPKPEKLTYQKISILRKNCQNLQTLMSYRKLQFSFEFSRKLVKPPSWSASRTPPADPTPLLSLCVQNVFARATILNGPILCFARRFFNIINLTLLFFD